eukprot:357488-Chlamydomonas_euryale.AAC.2
MAAADPVSVGITACLFVSPRVCWYHRVSVGITACLSATFAWPRAWMLLFHNTCMFSFGDTCLASGLDAPLQQVTTSFLTTTVSSPEQLVGKTVATWRLFYDRLVDNYGYSANVGSGAVGRAWTRCRCGRGAGVDRAQVWTTYRCGFLALAVLHDKARWGWYGGSYIHEELAIEG